MAHPLWKQYLKSHWHIYTIGVVSLVMTSSMQALTVRMIGWIIDFFYHRTIPQIFIQASFEKTFLCLFWTLFAAHLILTIGRGIWRITFARQTFHAQGMLRLKMWSATRYFPIEFFKTKFTKGHLLNANNSEVFTASFIFGFSLVGLVDMILLFVMTLTAMFTIDVSLTFLCLVVMSFLPWSIYKISQNEVKAYADSQVAQEKLNDLSAHAVETIKLQKVTNTITNWFERFYLLAVDRRDKRLGTSLLENSYTYVIGFASILTVVCLFVVGIQKTLSGAISVGDFVAMQGLVFLLQSPLIQLGTVISEWRKGNHSLNKISEIVNSPKDSIVHLEGSQSFKSDMAIVYQIKNLSFYYSNRPIFKNLSFEIQKNDRIGILGPIGAGKSTLAKILSHLIDENHGRIEGSVQFYGQELSSFESHFLRKQIIYVNQTPFIFARTVAENISLDGNLSEEQIWQALKLSGLLEDVKALDQGLDTVLGEMGINLSGGQKQRLALARAFARKPSVLIIDDSFSAIDTLTEELILSNIDNHFKQTTIVWIAHRASTLKYCDHIIDMSKYTVNEKIGVHEFN